MNEPEFSGDVTYARPVADEFEYGGSFHGVEVRGSVAKLTRILGEPTQDSPDGKTTHEWNLVGSDGAFISVYDYRYSGAVEQHWHVGGHNKQECLRFKTWFDSQSQE